MGDVESFLMPLMLHVDPARMSNCDVSRKSIVRL